MEPLIHFKGADILNGESVVIYGLDMDVMPGDLVYIVGKVGSGKTSIIRTVTAENRLLSGEGEACGYNLRGIKQKDIPYLRRKLGVVFQDFQLLTDRKVEDNLEFVLRAAPPAGRSAAGLTPAYRRFWRQWEWAPRPTRCPTSSPAVSSSA